VLNHRKLFGTFLLRSIAIAARGQDQPALADPEIVTDRPDITESGIVV
jgi:hypothetical protein